MTPETLFPNNEAIRERAAGILRAKTIIKRAIDRPVSPSSWIAYQRLEAAASLGVDLGSDEFLNKERKVIDQALSALRASIQQALVDRVMIKMIDLNRSEPDKPHNIELFPFGPPDKEAQTQQSPVDALKFHEEFDEVVLSAGDQARQYVATTVMVPDKLADIGLGRVDPLYTPVILQEGAVLSVPTVIKGVDLRFKAIQGETSMEFAMSPLLK